MENRRTMKKQVKKCRALHPKVRIQEKTLTKYEVRIQETQNWQKTKTLYWFEHFCCLDMANSEMLQPQF